MDCVYLRLKNNITIEDCRSLFASNLIYNINHIIISSNPSKEVMEQLSLFARKVETLTIYNLKNNNDWVNGNIFSIWKLKQICIYNTVENESFVRLIILTCTELTSIKLDSITVDDVAVTTIAQHCHKLESLSVISECLITFNSIIALSEGGLPLKELYIPSIPNTPTADISRRCSHALSCIRRLDTNQLGQKGQADNILLPYMTGLTSMYLSQHGYSYIPLLTQHCHNLTEIIVDDSYCTVEDILLVCYTNPLLQELLYWELSGITDTILTELIHACPHLHTLDLSYETTITDIGILALSELCPQLQRLNINYCTQVTEAAVLQLLQRCRKLTRMEVSRSSLSEETWTQLDKNTQKRVRRNWT